MMISKIKILFLDDRLFYLLYAQLMDGSSRHDMRDATRVLVMDQGFAILDSLEDEIPGLEGGLLGQAGGSALATVPNALVRSVFLFFGVFAPNNMIFPDGRRNRECWMVILCTTV